MKFYRPLSDVLILLDDEDFEWIQHKSWDFSAGGYPRTRIKGHNYLMHRLIMNVAQDHSVQIDHIDGNIWNNQKSNLRKCTHAQNKSHSKVPKNNKSGYKGIYKHAGGKWVVQIREKHVCIYLGLYENIQEAITAYNTKVLELRGEFAVINNYV